MKVAEWTPLRAIVANAVIGDTCAVIAGISGLLTGTWWLVGLGVVLALGIGIFAALNLRREWRRRDND